MVETNNLPNSAQSFGLERSGKQNIKNNGKGLKYKLCPLCGKKGYYKMPRAYEHCKFCGLHMILLPGQDF